MVPFLLLVRLSLWPLVITLVPCLVCQLNLVMFICCLNVTLAPIVSLSFPTGLVISIGPPLGISLSLFSIDRPVIDLSWKIAHGVLYTAARLFSFGLNYGVFLFLSTCP